VNVSSPRDILKICFGTEDNDASDEDVKGLVERYLYKHTSCGANITFKDTGVTVGSIIEGSDSETSYYDLYYPFTKEDWDQVIEAVESEADALWHEANDTFKPGDTVRVVKSNYPEFEFLVGHLATVVSVDEDGYTIAFDYDEPWADAEYHAEDDELEPVDD